MLSNINMKPKLKLKLKSEAALKECTLSVIESCVNNLKELKQPDKFDKDLIKSVHNNLVEHIKLAYKGDTEESATIAKTQAQKLDVNEMLLFVLKQAFNLHDETDKRDIEEIARMVKDVTTKYKSFKKRFQRHFTRGYRGLRKVVLSIV